MFLYKNRVNQNIINVNNNEIRKLVKDCIYYVLEFWKGILKTKWHYVPFIMSKRYHKGSIIPIFFCNLDLLKSWFHIKLRKNLDLTNLCRRSFLFGIGYLIHLNKKYLIQRLVKSKVFSKFDMKSRFWQIQIAENDKYKTTLVVPFGHYEWNIMSFGLKNAPS